MAATYEEAAEAVEYCLRKYGAEHEHFDIAVQDTIRHNRFSDRTMSLMQKAHERRAETVEKH